MIDWTACPPNYCNCEIQDGVRDGRHLGRRSYESTLKEKHQHSIFFYNSVKY